jgi:hypothetical protein
MKNFVAYCILLLWFVGCNPNATITKITDQTNTFKLESTPLLLCVESVTVFEMSGPFDNDPKCVWIINKKSKIPSSVPFQVTIPEIPDGYVQTFPDPSEKFQLCQGKYYAIAINYNKTATGTTWIAE